MLAGIVVLALLVAGWVLLTGRTLDRVTVTSGEWRCSGTSLLPPRTGGRQQAAPRMQPGMRCRRTLTVHNESASGARLDGVVVPGLGSEGAEGVAVASIDDRSPRPGDDARVDIGQHLAGGTSRRVPLVVVFRAGGCSPADERVRSTPRVTVSAWGRTRPVSPATGYAFAGTPDSDCLGRLRGPS